MRHTGSIPNVSGKRAWEISAIFAKQVLITSSNSRRQKEKLPEKGSFL
jgi:hypothetical protein